MIRVAVILLQTILMIVSGNLRTIYQNLEYEPQQKVVSRSRAHQRTYVYQYRSINRKYLIRTIIMTGISNAVVIDSSTQFPIGWIITLVEKYGT
jgi:hypothetical protein